MEPGVCRTTVIDVYAPGKAKVGIAEPGLLTVKAGSDPHVKSITPELPKGTLVWAGVGEVQVVVRKWREVPEAEMVMKAVPKMISGMSFANRL